MAGFQQSDPRYAEDYSWIPWRNEKCMGCIELSGVNFRQQIGSKEDAPEGCGFSSALSQRICQYFQVSCSKTRGIKTHSLGFV